ncbi:hypothetical protein E2C01_025686 [Portunus trituberculatus]|uniref:Uncharacterized protein n=1 Tax=Portunus trituberculatus TaxID=210409 RepID=A0A5B7EGL4_PORTR|nr:hypothetical protein [Portunus trituberculatus]
MACVRPRALQTVTPCHGSPSASRYASRHKRASSYLPLPVYPRAASVYPQSSIVAQNSDASNQQKHVESLTSPSIEILLNLRLELPDQSFLVPRVDDVLNPRTLTWCCTVSGRSVLLAVVFRPPRSAPRPGVSATLHDLPPCTMTQRRRTQTRRPIHEEAACPAQATASSLWCSHDE